VIDNGTTDTNVRVVLAADAGRVSAQDLVDDLNANAQFNDKMTAEVVKNADGVSTGIVVRAIEGGTAHGGVIGTYAEPNAGVFATGDGTAAAGATGLKFGDNAQAQASLGLIDAQIKNVSTARASLGALQNRFEHTINNLNVSVENLSASESRVRDADMAQEMMQFTRNQILSQAGTAMLAQANQGSQGVLQLLR
jgi:flagellin